MEKPKIYLAGKITKDWWRNEIFDTSGRRTPGVYIYSSLEKDEKKDAYYNSEYDAGEFIVTGPHSIGCDHSCYHNTPHASTNDENLTCGAGEYGMEKQEIFEACLKQINKSDIVFAYINDADAIGTIFELGYAYKMNKSIYIAFKNKELKNLHWFIAEAAEECRVTYRNGDLKNFFDKIIREYE